MNFFDRLGALWGMSGEEIYRNFRGRTGDDGDALYAAAAIAQRVRDRYTARMESITNLTTKMEGAWQGDGAGAAQRGAGPLAVEHGLAVPEIATARSSMQNQAEAFTSAKGAVVEVPPEPKEPSGWDNFWSFGQAGADYDAKKAQYNAANEHNQTIMEGYESASTANSSSMPTSYGRITDDHSAVGVLPPTPPPPRKPWPPPENTNNNDDDGSNNNNYNNNNLNNNQNNNQDPNQNQNQNQNPNDPNNPNQTDPNQNRPTDPSQVRPPGTGEPPPGRVPGPGGGGQNQGPGGAGYPGFMPPGGGFGPTGDDARSGSRGGYGGRGGGFGPGGSGGGSGAGGPGGRGGGLGGMPGAAAAAEGAAARGGIGGRGGMGMGGGPMGAGGNRGQGEDDTEHDRPSFLVEPDPHDTFGTDEVTAPPVIGE